jgi:hypothetical protein
MAGTQADRPFSARARLSRVLKGCACAIVALAWYTTPAPAQYMYLDSDGDGIHTATDRLNKTTPTTVDVWLNTNENRDGSVAYCDFLTGALDMNSYEIVLHAVGGTVTWGPMSNLIPGFAHDFARDARDTTGTVYYHNGWGGPTAELPGLHRLASLTVTVANGSPRIDIVTRHPINRTARTSFGSDCPANSSYDHTNRFGTNWLDTDGLDPPIDIPPIVTAPGMVLPQDDAPVQFGVSASDPDGDAIMGLTADLSGLPPVNDAAFTITVPPAVGEFTWNPTVNDSGNFAVTFTATTNYLPGSNTTWIRVIGAVTGVPGEPAPAVYRLGQNRPNPFNPGTEIDFSLAKPGHVRVAVYDASGRLVRELMSAALPAGPHAVRWDGRDETGRDAASGVYWCRLEAGSARLSRHMVLLR